jgi:hypothetical protein
VAKFVATDHKITVNGTDLSTSLHSVDLTIQSDEVDTTTFGQGGWKTVTGGLKSGSLKLNFYQDFGASAVDATLWPLLNTAATVVITPTSATVSATNPSYTAVALVSQYQPFSSTVGDLATLSVTWPTSGTVTRATA